MEQNVAAQKEKRKSEMKALQAQINPHFLYNTLDSIIWMAEAGQNDDVVLMTSALAKLLRQSISNDKEQVRVEEEMNYVQSYLTIQKMRYKDKLEYTIGVGVPNVQKRLQLYYGPEYGISYISRQGEGTVATVTIPLDGGENHE